MNLNLGTFPCTMPPIPPPTLITFLMFRHYISKLKDFCPSVLTYTFLCHLLQVSFFKGIFSERDENLG